ncbi:hypothetical protein [Kordia sp.]|uniref:hypothetical protein n=1 Tax=Kordia sp. TaxID=1965332 RepID=UPI003D292B53
MNKSKNKRLFFLLVNPVILLWLVFFIQKHGSFSFLQGYYTSFEKINQVVNNQENKTPQEKSNKYLWIDTSDASRVSTPSGSSIANRQMITDFISEIDKEDSHKLIVSTLIFDTPTPDDSKLGKRLERFDKTIFRSANKTALNNPEFRNLNYGTLSGRRFTKKSKLSGINLYKLDNSEVVSKSIPLLMYETINNKELSLTCDYFHFDNNKLFLKDFIPTRRITENEILKINLADTFSFLSNKENRTIFFQEYVKNRIVIIGNSDDVIKPIFYENPIPIAIYTLNVYESLENKDNHLSLGLIIIIYLILLTFSRCLLPFKKNRFLNWISKMKIDNMIVDMIFGSVRLVLALVVVSLLLFLFTNVMLDFSIVALVLLLERIIIKEFT